MFGVTWLLLGTSIGEHVDEDDAGAFRVTEVVKFLIILFYRLRYRLHFGRKPTIELSLQYISFQVGTL